MTCRICKREWHDAVDCPARDLGIRNAEHFASLGLVASLQTLRTRLMTANDDAPGCVSRRVFEEIDNLMCELADAKLLVE